MAEQGPKAETQKSESNQRIARDLRIVGILLAAVLLYLAGFFYAGQRFLPRTYIAGQSVAGLSGAEAAALLAEAQPVVTLTEREQGGNATREEIIDLKQELAAELAYDGQALLEQQDRAYWFLAPLRDQQLDPGPAEFRYDQAALDRKINQLYALQRGNNVAARDARIVREGRRFVLQPETEGSFLDREKAAALIREAVETALAEGKDVSVDLAEAYLEPQIRADDPALLAAQSALNGLAEREITITAGEEASTTLSGTVLADCFACEGTELVGTEALTARLAEFAARHDVCRYEYIDQEQLAADLLQAVRDGTETLPAPWVICYPEPGSAGNGSPSFIEVSISQQTLWYYEYGKEILTTPVVTGNPNAGGLLSTPTGYFTVGYKGMNVRLKGDDYDVKVKYWISIGPTRYYGFHDATWRWGFGGDIYTYNPSHGCVNMPLYVIAELYPRVGPETEIYIYP